LAFALQLKKKHGKTSVRVAGECLLAKSKQSEYHHKIISQKFVVNVTVNLKSGAHIDTV
jgi:hypothetical protein